MTSSTSSDWPASRHRTFTWRRAAIPLALALIVTLGALLRIEALVGRYGHMPRPAWTRVLDEAAGLASHLRPRRVTWQPVAQPYVGGDPINYLRFAREMRSFYQAHVREPVFLASTKAWLWVFSGADIGLSASSAFASTLVVLAAYLLGAAAYSPLVGLGAALAFAIEIDAIRWSVAGWRDDTFTLFVTLTAWRFIVLARHPSRLNASWAGVCAAAAILTRITALSFVVPGLVWIVIEAPRGSRIRTARLAAGAFAIAALLVLPYLINCAREFGDPFFAINYHTRYYRAAEGLPKDTSVGALAYVESKVVNRPLQALDTAAGGLFGFPLRTKFRTFDYWVPGLTAVLRALAAAGMILALWNPSGRLLLVMVLSSLVPYALTWSVGGGGEWRFTEHAYPIYLVLACEALRQAGSLAARSARGDIGWVSVFAVRRWQISAAAAAAVIVAGLYFSLPCLIARETLMAGEAAMLVVGRRDGCFLRGSWSPPHGRPNVEVRAAQSAQVGVRIPLPPHAPCLLTLRMDPPETVTRQPPRTVTVFLNRHRLGEVQLTRQPDRIGTYRFVIPAGGDRRTTNDLDLLASDTVSARDAGRSFGWLDPDAPVAFTLWYVRIEPLAIEGARGGDSLPPTHQIE